MKKQIALLLAACVCMMSGCSSSQAPVQEKTEEAGSAEAGVSAEVDGSTGTDAPAETGVSAGTDASAETGVSAETGASAEAGVSEVTLPASEEKHKIIIDTDTGADDSAALILAASNDNLEILGVTTLVGNVDLNQSTQNALAALEVAGCDAPVYEGSEDTYTGKKVNSFSVFGTDGMGDADLVHPTGEAEEQDAISFMIDTVKANPNEVEIVALGPATNIAKAMEQDPEAMKQVKRIWSMGTAGLGPGNASPVAEFNVYHDAEAYDVMLNFGVPVTVVGLDVCDGDALWTGAQFIELKGSGEVGSFVADSFGKIREFYANNGYGDTVMNCDPVTIMCLMYPEFVEDTVSVHGNCITDEGETYGQVIFYKEGFAYDAVENDFDYNVTLISQVDKENYFNFYLETIK